MTTKEEMLVGADDDVEEDEAPPRKQLDIMPLEVDYLQAALYYSVTEKTSNVLLFSTIESHVSVAAKKLGSVVRRLSSDESKQGGVLRSLRQRQQRLQVGGSGRSVVGEFYARHRMLGCASILVVLQVSLMHQLLFSVEHRSCSSSSDCVRGTSCSEVRRQRREANACAACDRLESKAERLRIQKECFEIFDSAEKLAAYDANDVEVWPRVFFEEKGSGEEYAPKVFVEFCAGCVDNDGTYKPFTFTMRHNVRAMRSGDFLALLVCAIAVGLTVVGELREIKVCNVAQRRIFATTKHRRWGHVWFAFLNALRAYLLIPHVIAAVPRLALMEGSDTISLVFNAISVIFITELDNLLTQRILSPSTVSALEKHARVFGSREDLRYLAVTQKVFVVGVVVVIFLSLFAEVRVQVGASLFLAYVGVYLEGLAELLFYDSEQPLLSRIIFTTCCGGRDCCYYCCYYCCCCSCLLCAKLFRRRRRRPLPGEPSADVKTTATTATVVDCETATPDDDDDDESEEAKHDIHRRHRQCEKQDPSCCCCGHLQTVASHRRRRRTFFTAALLQDVLAYTFEFYLVVALVTYILTVSLRTMSSDDM